MTVYYGNPGQFEPVNAAYLQLQEQKEEELVDECIEYIYHTCGNTCYKSDIDRAMEIYDIDYYLLPHWLQVKFDVFDIIE